MAFTSAHLDPLGPGNLFQRVHSATLQNMAKGLTYKPPPQTLDWLGQVFLGSWSQLPQSQWDPGAGGWLTMMSGDQDDQVSLVFEMVTSVSQKLGQEQLLNWNIQYISIYIYFSKALTSNAWQELHKLTGPRTWTRLGFHHWLKQNWFHHVSPRFRAHAQAPERPFSGFEAGASQRRFGKCCWRPPIAKSQLILGVDMVKLSLEQVNMYDWYPLITIANIGILMFSHRVAKRRWYHPLSFVCSLASIPAK